MPTISVFFGITVYLYAFDHGEPHLHAEYAEWEASFSIHSGEMIVGRLPNRAAKLVSEWIGLHHSELLKNWERCKNGEPPQWVEPLF